MAKTTSALNRLLGRLELEPAQSGDRGTWIGHAGSRAVTQGTRIFGGLVVAQTIMATGRTMAPRSIHSVQQAFLRPGQAHIPLHYEVEPVFEGRTFSSARVAVWQDDEVISHAQVGLSTGEIGVEHREPMVGVGSFEATVNRDELRGHEDWDDQPVEVRIDPERHGDAVPTGDLWFRAGGAIPDDPLVQRALLGYATDRAMLSVAWKPHSSRGGPVAATLNHSIWFHEDFDFADWHVHAIASPAAGDGRAMVFGSIYRQDGRLVASTAQEGMMRAPR